MLYFFPVFETATRRQFTKACKAVSAQLIMLSSASFNHSIILFVFELDFKVVKIKGYIKLNLYNLNRLRKFV